jgi:hypothetical protein
MTLQTIPVTLAEGYTDADGNALRDLPFRGPANEERPLFKFGPEQLDGAGFSISMVWTQLSAIWTARRLFTRQGEIVTLGIPLTGSGVDLFAVLTSKANAPAGQLWYAFDDGSTGSPGRLDWRGRATLYYRPASLVSALDGSTRALL